MIESGREPSKWAATRASWNTTSIPQRSGRPSCSCSPSSSTRLAGCADLFADAGYTTDLLEGEIPPTRARPAPAALSRARFQVLVSTDAGGEGIDLQSAHVMLNWDIPWSLVRLEQRMGRLHRIGQNEHVHIYHLVAPETREGRVQEVMLANLIEAGHALNGRIFDLIDATASGLAFRLLPRARRGPALTAARRRRLPTRVPTADELVARARSSSPRRTHSASPADLQQAQRTYAADRREAINPVIVEGFMRQVAHGRASLGSGPSEGLLRASAPPPLPAALGAGRACA